MSGKFCALLVITVVVLGACATPRTSNDPTLAKWAGQYGWQPYSWNGKEVYCHNGTGSGAQCMLSKSMAVMMAENQLPILPLSNVIYPLSPSVF
jgi:hypothetical protein